MIKSYKLVEFLIELDELEELWNVPFNWTHVGLLAEECAVLTADNKLELRECSTKSRPGICAYDPRVNTTIPADNLCPYPWKGSKIIDGQLVCFQIQKSKNEGPSLQIWTRTYMRRNMDKKTNENTPNWEESNC